MANEKEYFQLQEKFWALEKRLAEADRIVWKAAFNSYPLVTFVVKSEELHNHAMATQEMAREYIKKHDIQKNP